MSPDEEKHQPQQTNGINVDDDKHHQINGIDEDGSDSVFVKKILEIPTIYDIHNYTKENKYGKIGYQMVGSATNIVSNVTKPFQNQIRQADILAANSVGYVEEKFPFFKQPTAEIVDNLKKPITTVGTTIDSRCITPAMNIATNVQSQINQRAVEPTIEIAKKVDASFINVVNVFELTLNTYLPEDQSTSDRSVNTTNTTTINDDSTSTDLLQTFRAFNIALTGQRRLTRRVKAQINSTQEYTSDQIKQLQESSQLLKTASETVTSLNQMLLGIVANARGTVKNPEIASTLHSKLHDIASIILGNVNKNEDLPKAVQSRIIELSQTLLQTTDSIATYVKANATYFPDIRLKPLTEFFEQRYVEIVKEIKDGEGTPIEKARKVIMITTQHTLPLLNELQESVQSYSTSLNHSFINTTEKVKSRFIGVN